MQIYIFLKLNCTVWEIMVQFQGVKNINISEALNIISQTVYYLLNCPNYYLLNCWHNQTCLTFLHSDHLEKVTPFCKCCKQIH